MTLFVLTCVVVHHGKTSFLAHVHCLRVLHLVWHSNTVYLCSEVRKKDFFFLSIEVYD